MSEADVQFVRDRRAWMRPSGRFVRRNGHRVAGHKISGDVAIYPPFPVQGSDVTANEETRLRNLLLKKGAGTELKPLDVHFIRKLSAKKSAEESLDKKQKIIVTS